MAKIRKQKKSGMLKRQQQKRHNKMIRRRKTMPKRKQQLQNSPQLEQFLNALPTLAFEPELVDLSMDKARLMELMKNDQTETDMLMDLLSEEFVSDRSFFINSVSLVLSMLKSTNSGSNANVGRAFNSY